MIRMFIRHPVNDYTKWRAAYDAFDSERAGLGVTGHSVCCEVGDPNDVTITHDFDDLATAKGFADSARLKAVMADAGVAGSPTIWFTSPA